MKRIKQFLGMALATGIACGLPATSAHAAPAYPAKPITLIIGFPPGGGADHVGRVYANALSKVLQQPVVVENRPGAGSTIGASHAARAAADGYTLYLGNSSVMGSDSVLYKVDYSADSFVPVAQLTTGPMVLIANAKLGIRTVQDLLDRARKAPGKLNMASSGNGVITHLAGVSFMELAGVQFMHVPFKGGAAATQSVAAGDTDISFATAPSAKAVIDSGKVVGIAVTSANRSSLVDYPPIAETVAKYDLANWWGIFAPKGTPQSVVETLFAATNKVLADPAVRKSLESGYEEVTPSASSTAFVEFARREGAEGLRLAKKSVETAN
ncbi:tripartite tricarboxylate transporter substrate binding protein [Pusillimonas sp. TS35]|uniref:Bug family tripartite tricarboxylate transporter substrate binding protein n=1 Tax=Paracandidimonas lactea TaxID=2895524 RepID=UPI00136A14B2|nr:tripartite tricarboxylate transporter substrate-binding protein [Paracandidimonas lactea]MYN11861.1 tripartite tricarboxylate transporter substrate binding protein [Pusillimonas sp. TS35]